MKQHILVFDQDTCSHQVYRDALRSLAVSSPTIPADRGYEMMMFSAPRDLFLAATQPLELVIASLYEDNPVRTLLPFVYQTDFIIAVLREDSQVQTLLPFLLQLVEPSRIVVLVDSGLTPFYVEWVKVCGCAVINLPLEADVLRSVLVNLLGLSYRVLAA